MKLIDSTVANGKASLMTWFITRSSILAWSLMEMLECCLFNFFFVDLRRTTFAVSLFVEASRDFLSFLISSVTSGCLFKMKKLSNGKRN